jgi:hypothetical protein
MGYFKELPNIQTVNRTKNQISIDETIIIKNLFRRAKIRDDILNIVTAFEYYTINGNETPNQVAEKIYRDPELDWVVLVTNNIINVQDEWPIDSKSFLNYLLDKYGSEEELQKIHHYETIEVKDSFGRVVLPNKLWVDEAFYEAPEFKSFDTPPPGILFPPIKIPGTIASATPVLGNDSSNARSVVGFIDIVSGLGYINVPKVTFSDPTPTANAFANLVVDNFSISEINVSVNGFGYNSLPKVTISSPPDSIQSVATAVIDDLEGKVISIIGLNGGLGYGLTAPTVTFSSPPSLIAGSYFEQSSVSAGNQIDGMFVRDDGLKLYTTSTTGTNLVKQFSLSDSWDVTTLSFEKELDVSSDFSYCTGIEFTLDGTRMFVSGGVGGSFRLISYTLSTPWDISTATKLHQIFTSSPGGVRISPDGQTLFFLNAATPNKIEKYTLNSPWNLTTISSIQFTLNLEELTGEPVTLGFSFLNNGLKLFTTGESSSRVYEFDLQEPWNIENVNYINNFFVGDKAGNPSDIFVKSDQTRFFICGGVEDKIFQYEIISLAKGEASVFNGSVVTIDITQPGFGYTVAPTIIISEPFPSVQATAEVNLDSGIVSSITITEAGFGYVFAPSITIEPAPVFRRAIGIAIPNEFTGISTVAILDGGANYLSPPTITFESPDELDNVLPGDTYSQNNKTWRWNGTEWQEQFTDEFQYYDPTTSSIVKTLGRNISKPVSIYEYESDLNEKKRTLLILKPQYLSVIINDLRNIMIYDSESSTYITDNLKSTFNPKYSDQ